MLFDVKKQLDALTETLHLVSNVISPVQPGQKVEVKVLSAAPDLFVTDKVLDNPLLTGVAQLVTQIPVEIQVSWSVIDEAGMKLKPNEDFLASNKMSGPSVDFIFKPDFKELGTVTPLTDDKKVVIQANVKLRAWLNDHTPPIPAGAEPQEIISKDVPLDLPISLVPLEIPTLLALFRHRDFKPAEDDLTPGFVLMVVPGYSYLQELTEVMNGLLVQIEEAIRPLRTLVGLAAFLARLTVLRHALSAQPMLRLRHGDISHLDDIHMRKDTRLGIDILSRDLRPDNRVSSLILIGTPGKTFECFTRTGFEKEDTFIFIAGRFIPIFGGAFTVSTGVEMITLIPDLSVLRTSTPAEVVVDPVGTGDFNDSISSVRFVT